MGIVKLLGKKKNEEQKYDDTRWFNFVEKPVRVNEIKKKQQKGDKS